MAYTKWTRLRGTISTTQKPNRQAFNTSAIRVVTIDNNPWFVAADVCASLGLVNTTMALASLDEDCKLQFSLGLPGRKPWIISESGLYKLVMRSDKPEAKGFQDWVTKVVLPAIRKDGGYIMGEEKVVTGEMGRPMLIG